MSRPLILASALLAAGCGDTGTFAVTFDLDVAGAAVEGPIEGRDGWQVALSRADLAFGPLYLCSGTKAGDLCETARAEWTGSVVIDALDAERRPAGTLDGTTGFVRSWMYDHGITSLLTQPEPVALEAADRLGGRSLIVEGAATKDGEAITFSAKIRIEQQEETEIGVPVVRKSASEPFEHDITEDETSLLVRFDPRPWVADIDFSSLAEDGLSAAQLEAGSQGYRAITNAVVAGQRPTFIWGPTND